MIFSSEITKIGTPDEALSRLWLTYAAYADVELKFDKDTSFMFSKVSIFDFCEHLLFKAQEVETALKNWSGTTKRISFSDPNDLGSFILTPGERGIFNLTYSENPKIFAAVNAQFLIDSIFELCAKTIGEFSFHSGIPAKDISILFVPSSYLGNIDFLVTQQETPTLKKLSPNQPRPSTGWVIEG